MKLLIVLAGTVFIVVLIKGMHFPEVDGTLVVETGLIIDVAPEVTGYEIPSFAPIRDYVHFLEAELDSSHTVGAAFTIVRDGRISFQHSHGERVRGSGEAVDAHTLFRLASVSKGFAGALAAIFEENGILSLDEKVVDHYPGFSLKDSTSTADLSIRNILSHTTGLVPYAFDNLVEAGQSLPQIVSRLDEVNISAAPGELYGYQNVTFSMWDPIARRTTGTPYEVLVEEMIFKPLGMRDASVGPLSDEASSNMASPHVRTKSGYAALKPHMGYYNVLPAAGVNASISDMSQWLLALLGHKPEAFPVGVQEKLGEKLIYTPLKYRYTRNWQPFRERYYSLGWRIYMYRGRKIIYHGGYIRGYRAEIGFCPEEDLGIAFLQNSPNSLASRVVPYFFDSCFDHIDGLEQD